MPRPQDLLDKMRVSKNGWGASDLRRLYESFGFVGKEASNHTIYKHPSDPLPAMFEVNVSVVSATRTGTNILIVDVSNRESESDTMTPSAFIFPEAIRCGQLESNISMV